MAELQPHIDEELTIGFGLLEGVVVPKNEFESLAATNLTPFLPEPLVFILDGSPNEITTVGTLQGIDAEGDTISYSIAEGGDGSLFSMDPVTGELSFINPAQFASPQDDDGDNKYVVNITVADAFGSNTQAIEINVEEPICIDCGRGPEIIGPIPLAPFEPVRMFLNQSTTGLVTEVEIAGPDGNELFRLFGEDADRFDIDAATGLIALRSDANLSASGSFDGDAVYEVIVLVENTDGGSDTLEIEYLFFQGG